MKKQKTILCIALTLMLFVCLMGLIACEHTHTYGETASVEYLQSEATCTKKAVYYKSCSCGEKSSETFEYGDFAAHTYGQWQDEVAATCTTDGIKGYKDCSVCNKHFDNDGNEIESLTIAAAHTYGDWVMTTEPTCEDKGEERRDCENCDHYETREIAANGHTYGEWVTTTEPTCEDKGEERRNCEDCDHYETRDIDANGHTYGEWQDEVVATCTAEGTKGHKDCSVCNKHFDNDGNEIESLTIDKIPHNYVNGECTECHDLEFSKGLAYTLVGEEYSVTGIGTCKDKDIKIPSANDGKPVTSIGRYAFYKCTRLTSITIPDSITSIGESAFYECSSLTSIEIPSGVTSIGSGAFAYCSSLQYNEYDNAYYLGNSDNSYVILVEAKSTDITSCTINEKTKIIFEWAFGYCSSLSKVTIPSGVTSIGYATFWGCSNLTEVTIPSSVTSIVDSAFNGCSKLTSITIPSSVTSIGSSAFAYCSNLTEVTIPSGVTTIEGSLFQGCSSLSKVTIPSGVTSIGSSAFNGCSKLASVEIPDKVTSIEDSLFYGCSSLTEVTIPDNATSIGDYAFRDCSNLGKLTIGSEVTRIGYQAFSDCSSLKSVNYTGTVDKWAQIDFGGGSYDTKTSNPLYYAKKLYINDELVTVADLKTVTEISQYAFYNCVSLFSVTIPSGVTGIRDNSFYGCTSLIEVVDKTASGMIINCGKTDQGYVKYYAKYVHSGDRMVASVNSCVFLASEEANYLLAYMGTATELVLPDDYNGKSYKIYDKAFYECISLSKVTIGINVTNIGSSAFAYCSSLTEVTIPDSVTSIGNDAFSGCPIETATIPALAISCVKNNKLKTVVITSGESIGDSAFSGCSKLTSVTIPSSVTSIGSYAFQNCPIKTATVPSSVTSIGNSAFFNCTTLSAVYINDIAAWCNISFTFAASNPLCYAHNLYLNNELVTSLVIPSTVTKISGYAFHGCSSLTEVTIHSGVTSIGEYAFQNCSIETATIPALACKAVNNDKLKTVVITSGESIEWGAFSNCSSLVSVTIPSSVTSIGGSAFSNCSSLVSVTIPSSVTSIGGSAFSNCSSLTEVTIPSSVTSIESNTFYNCSSLTSITIPSSVTSIGSSAFASCSKLTSIEIPDSVTSIGGSAFSNCSSLTYNEYDNACYLGNNENPYVVLVKAKSTSITSCAINEKTKFIHGNAFYDCRKLTSITIPDSVKSIGYYAFNRCISLTSASIGNGVTSITEGVFGNCDSLTSVTVSSSVTRIEWSAFWGNGTITSVYYKGSESEWGQISIDNSNDYLTSATRYYYSESNPFEGENAAESGNYWHYDTDGKTIVVWSKQ